jgi:hypothetical protein
MQQQNRRLALEQLTTGEISITIEDLTNEYDVHTRVVPNGPAVVTAVKELLNENYKEKEPIC